MFACFVIKVSELRGSKRKNWYLFLVIIELNVPRFLLICDMLNFKETGSIFNWQTKFLSVFMVISLISFSSQIEMSLVMAIAPFIYWKFLSLLILCFYHTTHRFWNSSNCFIDIYLPVHLFIYSLSILIYGSSQRVINLLTFNNLRNFKVINCSLTK